MTREEAVARIKDHIEIHRYHERNAVNILEALDMAIKALEQPEIIMCKDCADYDTSWIPHSVSDRYYCPTMDSFMPEDGFCSFAERRKDGSD